MEDPVHGCLGLLEKFLPIWASLGTDGGSGLSEHRLGNRYSGRRLDPQSYLALHFVLGPITGYRNLNQLTR